MQSSPDSALRQFFVGLTQPSALSAVIACTIVVTVTLAYLLVLDAGFMIRHGDRLFAAHSRDYDTFVTSRALRLQRDPPRDSWVMLLGASTTRAALLEQDLSPALDRALGQPVEFMKLCTSGQLLWESAALLDLVPADTTPVVVLGISPGLFNKRRDGIGDLARHPRMGIRLASLDVETSLAGFEPPPLTGWYSVDNAGFLLARAGTLARNLLTGHHPRYVDNWYAGRPPIDAAEWSRQRSNLANAYSRYEDNWTVHQNVLQRGLDRLRDRSGARVLLVEAPVNPRMTVDAGMQEVAERHSQRMSEFAARNGIVYLDLNRAVGYQPGDFNDWGHLSNRDAMIRSANAVARAVRQIEDRES
jgi:hypothetical protein